MLSWNFFTTVKIICVTHIFDDLNHGHFNVGYIFGCINKAHFYPEFYLNEIVLSFLVITDRKEKKKKHFMTRFLQTKVMPKMKEGITTLCGTMQFCDIDNKYETI